ncbi:MAG: hypothetical protein OQK00_08200, partial [Rhodobacteraceae bacterium]|nr:hypothetical protein [Paracoccaceae bacterium]
MPDFLFKTGAILLLTVSPMALVAQTAPMASGTMEDLDALTVDGEGVSSSYDITPDGTTVVGDALTDTDDRVAVEWSGGGDPTRLGSLGGIYSRAWGVNSDGSVIVGESQNASGRSKAVRWVNGAVQDIDTLSTLSVANDVSADGAVVVGNYSPGSHWRAFRWTASGGMVDLGYLASPTGIQDSAASGVSADGSIVVGRSAGVGNRYRPFMWTQADGMVDLGTMRSDDSGTGWAVAVSGDNTTIVGRASTDTSEDHAFRWTEADGMEDLGDLTSDQSGWSSAHDVNTDGSVIVGAADDDSNNNKAFRWTEETGMQNLGTLQSDNSGVSIAWGVSDDGAVVVGWSRYEAYVTRAFIWTAGTMLDHENTLAQVGQNAAEQAAAVTALGRVSEFVLGQEIMDVPAADGGGIVSSQGRARAPVTVRFSLGASGNGDGDARVAGVAAATALAGDLTLGGYLGLQDYGSDLGGFDTDGAVGAFGLYLRQNAGGAGWTWKLAASHLGGGADITRAATLAATEVGTGSTDLRASSVLAEVGYGFDRGGMRLTPFGRLSHTKAKRDGYTEAVGIAFPVSYDDH